MPDPEPPLDEQLKEIEEAIEEAPSKAYEHLSTLLRQYSSHPKVLTLLSHVNVLMEYYDSAKAYAARAVLLEPSNIQAKFILGICHQRLGEFRDAVSVYTQITDATPTSAVAFLFLGETFSNCNDRDNAEEAYRKAVALDEEGDVGKIAKEALWKLWGIHE